MLADLFTPVPQLAKRPPTYLRARKFRKAMASYILSGICNFRPFSYEGKLWAIVSGGDMEDGGENCSAYLMLPLAARGEFPRSLSEKWIRDGMKGSVLDDPRGGYHGTMWEYASGRWCLLVGPEREFILKGDRHPSTL